MIARLTGVLAEVMEDRVLVECAGLGYEVLIPPASRTALDAKRGETVTLYTLHYLEGGMNATNPVPRLAGFLTALEREFAQRFITVKGMGVKAVLRAFTAPVHTIANAIERKDISALVQLPGVGKRSADQIIAELNGKVGKYALFREDGQPEFTASALDLPAEVLAILEQLGYSASEAGALWAAVREQEFASAEEAIQEIFRHQATSAV